MRAVALLALCFAAVAALPSQKIVGGSTTTINQYPSIVALLFTRNYVTWQQFCGGTLLNTRSVLTAAHCPIGTAAGQWRARVGSTFASSGGVVHNFASYVNHPNYNTRTLDNDISVMRSATTIALSNVVQAASIAGPTYVVGDNQVVWAAGWGHTNVGGPASETLRHVQVWAINQATCRARYATVGDEITDNMLCSGWLDVGGRDQCQGDSGGPLYHNGVVVGVCSWGRSCALAFFPGVNARVSRYTAWIQANA